METNLSFFSIPVIGRLEPDEAAEKLREIDEPDLDELFEAEEEEASLSFADALHWRVQDRPWQHTAHTFGYLEAAPPGSEKRSIMYAGNIEADETLKNARIRITLDKLRVAAYPGGGAHRVLLDFYAQNEVGKGSTEHLHFNATFRIAEGESAAVSGHPIFDGLKVGSAGVSFKCFTVNVKNDQDEAFLQFLDSDIFKSGLKLATTAIPVIGQFSQMAMGVTKSIASRNKNIPVQDFYMGLDFSQILTHAKLRVGSYIAVQIPEKSQEVWNWEEWVYNPVTGNIVEKANPAKLIPYNYLVFGVQRCAD